MAPITANEALKVSYASMIKQGRPPSPTNTPHKIVSVAANADLPTTPKRTQANSFVQALMSSRGGEQTLHRIVGKRLPAVELHKEG
ncbi:hypothetical protein BC332_27547 [Capsicum chinense]|nr:hypothetical protein BC332_27547 [Capsicum chinense]